MNEIEPLTFSDVEDEIFKTVDAFLLINHRAHIQHSLNGLRSIVDSMTSEMKYISEVCKDVGSIIRDDLDSFNDGLKTEFTNLIPLQLDKSDDPILTPNLLRIILLSIGISKGNMGVWVALMREIFGDVYDIKEPKLNTVILQTLRYLEDNKYILIFSDKPLEELEKLSSKKEDALRAVSMMHIALTEISLEYLENLLVAVGIEEPKQEEYNLADMEPASSSVN